jgi:hypothetical protein
MKLTLIGYENVCSMKIKKGKHPKQTKYLVWTSWERQPLNDDFDVINYCIKLSIN